MIANALHAPTIAAHDDAQSARRLLVFFAAIVAREELNCIVHATDAPDWRDVDAVDHLDAADALLTRSVKP